MNSMKLITLAAMVTFCLSAAAAGHEPLALHPENPHHFLFREKPAVLVGSTEHYGAVLNLDFDFVPYLDELHANGLNLTRAFSGAYCEAAGNFNIKGNTLAPAEGRLICPWARSDQPGYAGGGAKFDLDRWDPAYLKRLRNFVREASQRGIVVEFVLFCPFYEDSMWAVSPLNAKNNINGVGTVARTAVYRLEDPALGRVQDALVRKLAEELNEFDNLYYEICNEPYFGGVTLAWQTHIAAVLTEAEKKLPRRHLIAQNIANASAKIDQPDPLVSVFNFHYATPPDAVAQNYALGKPLGDDETGFRGGEDATYRTEGWDFLLAGGAVYDNLDYSFTTEHEDGTARPDAPGGGGRELRRQLGILKRFMESFDLPRMKPDAAVIAGGLPDKATARVLSDPGKAYALYLRGGQEVRLKLKLPVGRYRAEWLHPRTGETEAGVDLTVAAETIDLASPRYDGEIALAIRAQQ
jgi:hypothetical protein